MAAAAVTAVAIAQGMDKYYLVYDVSTSSSWSYKTKGLL